MKLPNSKMLEIKSRLKNLGWKDQNIESDFEYFLAKKHVSRYEELLTWMRQKKLSLNESNLYCAYKFDVIIRSKLSKILKPIELQIIAHICYALEMEKITMRDIMDGSLYEDNTNFKLSLKNKRLKTKRWIHKKITKRLNEDKNTTPSQLVNTFTFGQIVGFIQLLDTEWISKVFGQNKNKVEIIEILENVVELRNRIAHHNILLSTSSIQVKNRKVLLSDLIYSLSMIASGDYRTKLTYDLNKYYKSTMNSSTNDGLVKKDIEKLFQEIKLHVIGV